MSNTKEQIFASTYRVALCQSVQTGIALVVRIDSNGKALPGYVQISEARDLQFSPLADDAVIQNAVAEIDATERALRNELARKLAELNERRAQLLSLTHQPEAQS